jgi:hypothetical protein
MMQAAHFGQVQIVEFMIQYYKLHNAKRSMEPNARGWPETLYHLIERTNENKTTPLMRAAQQGHISVVMLLVAHGAKIYKRNRFGMSPLMFAAQAGHTDICQFLIQTEPDFWFYELPDHKVTPLLLASKRGHANIVRALVSADFNLFFKDRNGRTVQEVISHEIERRLKASEVPPPHEDRQQQANRRRRLNDNHYLDQIDFGDEDDEYMKFVPIESYQKIVHMLKPNIQVELMQFRRRAKRSFEIIRVHTLLQSQRANIKITDGTTYDIGTAVEMLTTLKKTSHSTNNTQRDTQLDEYLIRLSRSDQMLLRVMLLPTPLVQAISQFIPIPLSFIERVDNVEHFILESEENSNCAISLTLDVIDELLEEGGFLSACDAAQIPAPTPHPTWCQWKHSAKATHVWNDVTNTISRERLSRSPMTECPPPLPLNVRQPTIAEQRRLVGYTSLLSKYESNTNIVSILLHQPYQMPRRIIDKLIRIADIASLCRRCDDHQTIDFGKDTASDVIALADDLYSWIP